jgi:hypothetical protein
MGLPVTAIAASFTTASTLQPDARSAVVARFSIGGGNPNAPDNAPSVRGLALSLSGPGGDAHEFVLLNTPVFTAATPESFVRGQVPVLDDINGDGFLDLFVTRHAQMVGGRSNPTDQKLGNGLYLLREMKFLLC